MHSHTQTHKYAGEAGEREGRREKPWSLERRGFGFFVGLFCFLTKSTSNKSCLSLAFGHFQTRNPQSELRIAPLRGGRYSTDDVTSVLESSFPS